jgi:hypothetical protein
MLSKWESMEKFLQQNLAQIIIGGIILINVVIWSFVIMRAILRRRRHVTAWQGFADQTGLRLDPGGLFANPRVSGNYDGRVVELSIFHRTRSGYSSTYTRLTVSVNNPHFRSLEIARHGTLMGLLDRTVSGEDIQVGNAEFDSRMTVRGEPPEMIQYALGDSAISYSLMEIKRESALTLRQSDNHLVYQHGRLEVDVDYLVRLLKGAARLAVRIESWQPPPGWGIETVDTRKK